MSYKSKHTGAQVDEAVSKVLNGEVGGGADWNALKGEAGYIENKPNLDVPFEKGDADNSAVLKGGNNQVISEGGAALGKDNFVGLKGWYINNFNNSSAVHISNQNTELGEYIEDDNFNNPYEVGDIISIQIGSIFTNIGRIEYIKGNYMSFTPLRYFSVPQSDPEKRYYLWVLSKPNAGVVDLGQNGVSYGLNNQSLSECAYTEGKNNKAIGKYAHVEGKENEGHYCSHVEGSNNMALGNTSHAEGTDNRALNSNTHVEGRYTSARGYASHAEGYGESVEVSTEASGEGAHAEGRVTKAQGNYSHTEGQYTSAVGIASHAEGKGESVTNPNLAEGNYSHVEGEKTKTRGVASHSEGMLTEAIGKAAHSEGRETKTTNDYTHAEGYLSEAGGIGSHAEGVGTQTKNNGEHAEGRFNKSNSVAPNEGSNPKNTLHSVGMGTSDTARKNAHEIMQDGKHYIYGVGGYDGTNPDTSYDLAKYLPNMVNITYDELVALRDNSKLVSGQQYRITDYVTTTIQENTRSAGHQFDIIVTALDESTLSENASAIRSDRDYDGYFQTDNLEAWQLKYCLDNDTKRFAWADATNGKGVIYYMKDEWNNECPYDFKNIQFARWKLSNPVGYRNDYDNWVKEDTTFNSLKTGFYGLDGSTKKFYYGYNIDDSCNKYRVEYTISESPTYFYTFGVCLDPSMIGWNYGNVIKEYKNFNNKLQLNNIVFLGNGCHDNSFCNDCHDNSFGEHCRSNSFGYGCYDNSFGNSCYSNSFGNECDSNNFGNYCYSNSFGEGCNDNSFGDYSDSNSFGNYCNDNSFGEYCDSNSFGDVCFSNSFGNNCACNSFGYDCNSNSFGSSSTSLKSFYRYIIFDNGNCRINLNCTSTTSSSNYFQNVRIGLGVNNTSTYKTITDSNVGQAYQTVYKPTDSKELTA